MLETLVEIAVMLMGLVAISMMAILPTLLVVGWFAMMAFAVLFAIATLAMEIWMLLDCIKREEFKAIKGENAKMMWVLILMFTGAIGAVIYYFLEKHEPKKK